MSSNRMLSEETKKIPETLSSFIKKDCNPKISHRALFIGFKHRIKVEYLKSFVV